jgi:hypothetical protein
LLTAPADQYESEAQLRKDNLVPAVPDGATATLRRTQLLSDFVEKGYFPKAEAKLKASTLRSYRQVYNCYVKPRTNGHRMCDFTLPSAQKFLDGIAAKNPVVLSCGLRCRQNRRSVRSRVHQSVQGRAVAEESSAKESKQVCYIGRCGCDAENSEKER